MNEWADWQKEKKRNILISDLINNKYIDEIKIFKMKKLMFWWKRQIQRKANRLSLAGENQA
jgi:hypothetical protein